MSGIIKATRCGKGTTSNPRCLVIPKGYEPYDHTFDIKEAKWILEQEKKIGNKVVIIDDGKDGYVIVKRM
jgi:hypothetical protein